MFLLVNKEGGILEYSFNNLIYFNRFNNSNVFCFILIDTRITYRTKVNFLIFEVFGKVEQRQERKTEIV